jgi:hypothetical protein
VTFREVLSGLVTLRLEGASASSDGGTLKEFDLRLSSYGFTGKVRVWIVAENAEDEFLALVSSPGLLQIELRLAKSLYRVSPVPGPLALAGIVRARHLREVAVPDVSGSPVLYREYSFEFCDAAQALWSEHRPCGVYAKTSIDSLVKQHTPSPLSLRSAWSLGKRVRPMVCLGLGEDDASFYDFVFWLADAECGHVWYDYAKQALVLDSAKASIGPQRDLVFGAIRDMGSVRVTFAPPPRAAVQLLNSRDGSTSKRSVEQPNAIEGVRRYFLLHTPIEADAQGRQSREKSRSATGQFEVRIECDAYPEMYIAPGSLLKLGEEFGGSIFLAGKSLRVLELNVCGVATDQTPEFDIENSATEYEVSFTLHLEAAEDPRWRGFDYRAPRYPLRVEGKIVSAVGSEGDRAYTVYSDSGVSDTYKVNFALWNSTIAIDMTPDFLPGHLYFPAYKDSRVFVALDFDTARIERYLDWGKDVTVPSASLGNHLLLGKNETSETSIKHWYVDNSPELVIGRVHSGDMGTLTVKEGTLTLELTDENGVSGFAATTSVEPQAQLAKAEIQQKSDLAVADLEAATSGAETELTASVGQATATLRGQAEQLASQIDRKSRTLDQALTDVGTSIDARAEEAEGVSSEARQRLDGLLE